MNVNFRTLACLFLLIFFSGFTGDAFARKRLKVFRVKIIHYNNSHTKGILFDVKEDGMILAQSKDVVSMPQDLLIKRIKEGLIPLTHVPFDQVKKVGLWRRKAVGRNFAIGAVGSMAVAGAITMVGMEHNNSNDEHCGCGPPVMLIIPPVMAILGGTVGVLIGVFPKKVVTLNPDKLFESARDQLGKYSIVTQL